MEYILKLGTITDTRKIEDPDGKYPYYGPNNYQVRVLPDMADITDTAESNGDLMLPRYPSFYGHTDYAYQIGDMVWITCTQDFQVGYILGYFQPYAGENISSFLAKFNALESMAGLELSNVGGLAVTRLSDSCITMTSIVSGTTLQMYSSDVYYLYCSDGSIYMASAKTMTHISKDGDINIWGNSVQETYTDSINTIARGKVTEDFGSQYTSTVGSTTINSGGSFGVTATSGISMNAPFGGYNSLVLGNRTESCGGTNIVNSGLGEYHQIAAGAFTVTVAAGGVSIFSTGPIAFTSTSLISLAAPLVTITAGLLSMISCPIIQLPIFSPMGWAVKGLLGVSVPTLVGI